MWHLVCKVFLSIRYYYSEWFIGYDKDENEYETIMSGTGMYTKLMIIKFT
ncbi:hypothetical protein F383_33773 [Gossypium arboreum]|uniref:Uncharacterized protein n=1 Tax=Gossypium arboreum TaxID=29729 RepID=A0A0B0M6X0_GOSAR|nr:hypothetical protein F383_36988 [Gossypium arboreum]KHG26462.1 hypothetical protein F383_33773 [Gossypium arboreum]